MMLMRLQRRLARVLEAIVLVGGQGTRLRPLTLTTPKPLLPVAGVPFLLHQFARLRDAGVTRIVLATSYRAELFESAFGSGEGLGVELVFVSEDEPMGTGGAIANAAAALVSADDAPVIVFNGDVVSGHDLRAQLAMHADVDADATLHLVRVDDARAFGCVPTDADGRVTDFLEKMPQPVTDQINAGCYVFRRSVIASIPTDRPVSVERETFPGLLAAGARVQAYIETAYWLDLGTPAAYVKGSSDLVTGVIGSSALPGATGPSLVLAGAVIDADCSLTQGSVVGARTRIGSAHAIRSVIFDDVVIEDSAVLDESIVGRAARIGAGASLTRCVVADGAIVPAGVVLVDALVTAD
jgi:mannose-1-phosphate guanylyltransferase